MIECLPSIICNNARCKIPMIMCFHDLTSFDSSCLSYILLITLLLFRDKFQKFDTWLNGRAMLWIVRHFVEVCLFWPHGFYLSALGFFLLFYFFVLVWVKIKNFLLNPKNPCYTCWMRIYHSASNRNILFSFIVKCWIILPQKQSYIFLA